jgi:hypothetical protein
MTAILQYPVTEIEKSSIEGICHRINKKRQQRDELVLTDVLYQIAALCSTVQLKASNMNDFKAVRLLAMEIN